MITDLVALLMILGAFAAAGIMFAVRRRQHERAELRAEEARLAEQQELFAAWARVHRGEPSGVDPRDRLPL